MFNKSKCKVLHLNWGNTRYQSMLGDGEIYSSLVEKDLEVLVSQKMDANHKHELADQKANSILGLQQKTHGK